MTSPTLRTYQHDAVEAVFREWETHTSTMIVKATGLGKGVVIGAIVAKSKPKRSIIVAHRLELIHQLSAHVTSFGTEVEIEMADKKADASMFQRESAIVASVQTLTSGPKDDRRMKKFRPEDFGVLIIDEGHHSVAKTYREIIDHFQQNKNLRICFLTATPDRGDDKALGQVCESVAYKYDIAEAIEDGYLVPIEQQMIQTKIDYSHIRTTAGDLNGADLAQVMEDEEAVQGMVGASIKIIGNRPSIAFTSSVRHAEMCCEIFNRHRSGMAAWICGETPAEERAKILKQFKNGEVQVIANVGIATEGFDAPNTQCIIMGRPTKSRALYTQCVGRGTRALAGTLDELHSAFERREAITESPKPACLVLDFVGNSGKHKLITTADILGGKYDEETRSMAVADVSESGGAVRMADALKKADEKIRARIEQQKRDEAARKAKLIAQVQFSAKTISPFDILQITPRKDSSWDRGRPLSDKQKAILRKMGVNPDDMEQAAARQLLHKHFERMNNGLASIPQLRVLMKAGYAPEEIKKMTFVEASRLIDHCKSAGWKRTDKLVFA